MSITGFTTTWSRSGYGTLRISEDDDLRFLSRHPTFLRTRSVRHLLFHTPSLSSVHLLVPPRSVPSLRSSWWSTRDGSKDWVSLDPLLVSNKKIRSFTIPPNNVWTHTYGCVQDYRNKTLDKGHVREGGWRWGGRTGRTTEERSRDRYRKIKGFILVRRGVYTGSRNLVLDVRTTLPKWRGRGKPRREWDGVDVSGRTPVSLDGSSKGDGSETWVTTERSSW